MGHYYYIERGMICQIDTDNDLSFGHIIDNDTGQRYRLPKWCELLSLGEEVDIKKLDPIEPYVTVIPYEMLK